MAAIQFWSRSSEFIIKISIETNKPCKMAFIVQDSKTPYCDLINDVQDVNGSFDYYCRVPLCSSYTIIRVFNIDNGDLQNGQDQTFKSKTGKIGDFDFDILELEKRLDECDINLSTQSFIRLAQKFSFNAGILNTDVTYTSGNGKFNITYLDEIRDYETKQFIDTPFRISAESGLIEASKKHIINYTVPMRMVLLLHEYAHFYLNQDISNEVEADIRGLLIYLSLGYPRKEAYEAFDEAVDGNKTADNEKRLKIINQFISDFENKNYLFNE